MKIKIALSCAILILLFLLGKSCKSNSSLLDANVLLNKKIERTVNKLGEETAIKQALEIDSKSFLKQLRESEAVNKELRERITKNTHAGFNTRIVTRLETITKTDSIIFKDSLFPIYMAFDSTKWISYRIVASKDSVRLERLKIINEITGVFNEKRSVFKKDKIELELTNHNPFTSTETMQSFIYNPKKKRIGLGIMGGYGINSKGLNPFIGVGISYNLIIF